MSESLRVAAVQDAPVFLDRKATTERVLAWIERARAEGIELLAFGETYLPGYPFWLTLTDGARFDDPGQKAAYRQYVEAAVEVEGPEIQAIVRAAQSADIAVVLGIVERRRGAGSVFATALTIDPQRGVVASHRKLMPTYEERLVWSQGDGYGLRVHALARARVSALNCWENWLPAARLALYGQHPQVHVALWPGSVGNTHDITRFIAKEGRVFVISAGALLRRNDICEHFALADKLPEGEIAPGWFKDGGSAIAGPDGAWIVEPVSRTVGLVCAELDLSAVLRERQNFDPVGHYSRSDVLRLEVDRRRLSATRFIDDAPPEPIGRDEVP